MTYELAVLTHGDARTLRDSLASFREHVRPLPDRIRLFGDALLDLERVIGVLRGVFPDVEDPAVGATHPSRQAGFCSATARLWNAAAADDVEHVFWLEHDFVFERSVSVEQMAGLLEQEGDDLAQVALVRNAESLDERRAGGLIASRPNTFRFRESRVEADGVSWGVRWLEHRAFFTTNPSLMRRDFMLAHPFLDDGRPYCEGRFGIDLVEQGFRFAYWGDGEQYVRHIGTRDGIGY